MVTSVSEYSITVEFAGIYPPHHGAFIVFTKNQAINTSSLLGYYADVKFENNSRTKAELF